MTLTVSLLGDHKGITSRKVMGDEYVVDAAVAITVYHTADVINASDLGLKSISAADIQATDSTGAYASTSTFHIYLLSNDDADDARVPNAENITDTTIRIRVWGQI